MNSIVSLIITLAVFLVLREVVCWYWKMNETVKLLTEMVQLLKSIDSKLSEMSTIKKE